MISALIVDDEPSARKRIRNVLKNSDDIRIVGEAGSVKQGLAAVRALRPDLVFLDVEMPGANGFELVERVGGNPLIVFVSGHEGFALDAFDVEAVDYVLKPFTAARFERALDRVRQRIATAQSAALGTQMRAMMRAFDRERDDFLHQINLKHRGRQVVVDLATVVCLESDGNYVGLRLEDGRDFLYRSSMSALCEQLDPTLFLRIHRGIAVNLTKITKHHYLNNALYRFHLSDGTEVTSGRAYRADIEAALSRNETAG
ncbi:LytR/AlgR family response regulator transcription factor [Acanthopleuribacter pedis]|uniref:Response regulator transcription factor n=1 Tax=Acanthopleuribacter pedis TaxID=442870 RepID=A0A8J7Q453_9BACT|nr:LytTR family DNA-binding domain-containing protein [Acanthopleuribacter pedis]MBO1317712.1 response regulator transcription factor [Acanthopleuribacter pedis]